MTRNECFVVLCLVLAIALGVTGLVALINGANRSPMASPWEPVVPNNPSLEGLSKVRIPEGWIYRSQDRGAILFVPAGIAAERS